MKKIIFTLLIAFIAFSMAVNAQNSSKVSYNDDGSVILSEALQAKLKAKGVTAEDYLKTMAVQKPQQQVQSAQKQTTLVKPKFEVKTIDKSKLKIKQVAKQAESLQKQAISKTQKEDLSAKANQMNLNFRKKNLPYKTKLTTVAGKQYIEIVNKTPQYGMNPIKSQN